MVVSTPTSPPSRVTKSAPRRMRKVSDYGLQLQEKQRLRNTYGLREKTFRRLFTLAAKNRAQTGQALLTSLERRLDNVVFRSGLAISRAQGRQQISHRHFHLNGKRVNIPSQPVKAGDQIALHRLKKIEINPNQQTADWLSVNKQTGAITVKRLPAVAELPVEFDTQKVIEFYSK